MLSEAMHALVKEAMQRLNLTETDMGRAFLQAMIAGDQPETVVALVLKRAGLAQAALELEKKGQSE
jgi:hypothetical protein